MNIARKATHRAIGKHGWPRRATGVGGIAAVTALVLGLSACDSLLEVDLPGRLPAAELENPAMVQILVNSVQADFECAYAHYAAYTGLYTDEWVTSSSFFGINGLDSRYPAIADAGGSTCSTASNVTGANGPYQPLHIARAIGERAAEIISAGSDVADKDRKLATIFAYVGYTYTLLGEGFCEIAVDGGPRLQPAEAFALAEARFSSAISSAQTGGATDVLNWARVGRARVRLNLGNTAGAVSDADLVPQGFLKNATFDASPGRRQNVVAATNRGSRVHSLHFSLRNLQVGGVTDTRLQSVDMGVNGHDGQTRLWATTKYADNASPIPLAKWEEAQLIIAEVRGGQDAVDAINRLRNAAPGGALPNFSSTDAAAIRAEILEERRRVLFGDGHRLGDILRIPEFVFEQGVNHKNTVYYAESTCLPLPNQEINANPNAK